MANLVNIWAESGADLIGDDSTPTLEIKNTSSGLGLNIDTTGGTGSAFDAYSDNTSYAARVRSNIASSPALVLSHGAVVGSATIAPLELVASTASQAFIAFGGILLSTASMNTTAAQSAFHIPVYHKTNQSWGFIAVSKGPA